jgi:glycosyltransferase involved in cell wall biosynthesis
MKRTSRAKTWKLSVVVPALNEESAIKEFVKALKPVLFKLDNFEVIFVDDGSVDGTLEELKRLEKIDRRWRYISLSRNFGHQHALKAGIDHATGDCIVTLDCDLQHPPELIPKMVDLWQEGFDVVYTVRQNCEPRIGLKRLTSAMFYWLMGRISDVRIPAGAADFRLVDRQVADVLRRYKEAMPFFRGYLAWIGFKQVALSYMPGQRIAGKTRYTMGRMMRLAAAGITGFSIRPLRIATYVGFCVTLAAFGYGIYVVGMRLLTDRAIEGWTSIMVAVLGVGGVQMMMIGVLGEYLGKLFMESKNRPVYIVREKSPGL